MIITLQITAHIKLANTKMNQNIPMSSGSKTKNAKNEAKSQMSIFFILYIYLGLVIPFNHPALEVSEGHASNPERKRRIILEVERVRYLDGAASKQICYLLTASKGCRDFFCHIFSIFVWFLQINCYICNAFKTFNNKTTAQK